MLGIAVIYDIERPGTFKPLYRSGEAYRASPAGEEPKLAIGKTER
jgi:hypothetical protein